MIHVCIRWPIEPHEQADFELHARRCSDAAHRCGGRLDGYYLPDTPNGPSTTAFALIAFDEPEAYERYRETLKQCTHVDRQPVLNEDGSVVQRMSD